MVTDTYLKDLADDLMKNDLYAYSYAIINELIPKDELPTLIELVKSGDKDNILIATTIARTYIK